MIDNRTATAVTPVDDETCDVRFSVWIGREPGLSEDDSRAGAIKYARGVIEQFEADIYIWSHQKYADPAALARGEYAGLHRTAQLGRSSSIPKPSAFLSVSPRPPEAPA